LEQRPGAVLAIVAMCAAGTAAKGETLDAFLAGATAADVVILGEVHDNPRHHEIQARAVAALRPDAIVFEMIAEERTGLVNVLRARRASRADIRDALDWDASGWPEFDYYAPIMEAASEARIYGAGQSSTTIRKAAQESAAAAFGAHADRYGLTAALDEDLAATLRQEMATAHCDALPAAALDGMVEVQRLRDAALARAALTALAAAGKDAQVVVIAGNGHADRERGAPRAIEAADPETEVRVLGLIEGPSTDARAYDAAIVTAPPDRDDPCAVFERPGTD
jgi:uncharacterized iron-regulated protein